MTGVDRECPCCSKQLADHFIEYVADDSVVLIKSAPNYICFAEVAP